MFLADCGDRASVKHPIVGVIDLESLEQHKHRSTLRTLLLCRQIHRVPGLRQAWPLAQLPVSAATLDDPVSQTHDTMVARENPQVSTAGWQWVATFPHGSA